MRRCYAWGTWATRPRWRARAGRGVRDLLDQLGIDYEHVRSEPEDDRFPQTAYFYVPDDSADDVERAFAGLATEHGFDAEVL